MYQGEGGQGFSKGAECVPSHAEYEICLMREESVTEKRLTIGSLRCEMDEQRKNKRSKKKKKVAEMKKRWRKAKGRSMSLPLRIKACSSLRSRDCQGERNENSCWNLEQMSSHCLVESNYP
tara:strand:- start:290 stop:652 length:363 start_codon:yes stop_codon:yes gene_type:complete